MIGAFIILLFTAFICIVSGMVAYAIIGARKLGPDELPSKGLSLVIGSLETAAVLIAMIPMILLGMWIFMEVWWLGIIVIVIALCIRKIAPIDDIMSCKIDGNRFVCELNSLLFSKNKSYEETTTADDPDVNILKDYIEESGLVHVQKVRNPHNNNIGSFKPNTRSKAFMASQRAASIINKSSESV